MTNYSSQLVVVHCKHSMLPMIKELDLNWEYSPRFGSKEVDVYLFDINDINSDEEFVSHWGLDYDQVNCIELAQSA